MLNFQLCRLKTKHSCENIKVGLRHFGKKHGTLAKSRHLTKITVSVIIYCPYILLVKKNKQEIIAVKWNDIITARSNMRILYVIVVMLYIFCSYWLYCRYAMREHATPTVKSWTVDKDVLVCRESSTLHSFQVGSPFWCTAYLYAFISLLRKCLQLQSDVMYMFIITLNHTMRSPTLSNIYPIVIIILSQRNMHSSSSSLFGMHHISA